MARLGRNRMRLELVGHIEFTLNAGVMKIVLRVLIDVGCHVLQRVVVRVHRPDNFIEGMQQFTRGVGNGADLISNLTRRSVIS